eukprot:8536286-Lingulodinium_polyedra.AAC.1
MPNPTVGVIRKTNSLVRRARQDADLAVAVKGIAPADLRFALYSGAAFLNASKLGTQAGYV